MQSHKCFLWVNKGMSPEAEVKNSTLFQEGSQTRACASCVVRCTSLQQFLRRKKLHKINDFPFCNVGGGRSHSKVGDVNDQLF